MAARLEAECNMPIIVASDPLNCVALGSGMCLEELDTFSRMLKTHPSR
jgi:actin-like ATPase involved in cell morphogenesis